MNDDDLDAIRARAEAATEGPWSHRTEDDEWQDEYLIIGTEPPLIAELVPRVANAEFIAHARKDVPALLDEVERLRALVPKCACGPWHPDMDGPDEECPQHGRSYREWIDRGDRLAATVDRVRVLITEWENLSPTTGPFPDRVVLDVDVEVINPLRAAIEGTDS